MYVLQITGSTIKSGIDLLSYEEALEHLGLKTLERRREELTSNFALETFKNERHRDILPKRPSGRRLGRTTYKVETDQCRTGRFYNSSIPYMKRLLNDVISM